MGMTIDKTIKYFKELEGHTPRAKDAKDVAIDTMRKYQQLQSEYEARLNADMVDMLTDIKKEIDEIPINADNSEPFRLGQASAYDKCENLIQQKINELKGVEDGNS